MPAHRLIFSAPNAYKIPLHKIEAPAHEYTSIHLHSLAIRNGDLRKSVDFRHHY